MLLKRTAPVALPTRAIQFGEGNFLRAFIDWMLNGMNQQGKFNGSVTLVQPQPRGMAEAINAQEGLYTLLLRGVSNGKVVEKREIIEVVAGCIDAYTQWEALQKEFSKPTVKFIFSNTTEAGIEYKEEAYTPGKTQTTFPAKLTALVFERFKQHLPGVTFIPCELIEHNGKTLKKCILQYAKLWKLPTEFAGYIEQECVFVDTLVDRIVAGYPRAEAAEMEKSFGYEDKLIDCGEIFHFFVLECAPDALKELPLAECGFNVCITDDLTPYRTRKVRFLNGAHTANVLAAILGGLKQVDEMMNDPLFGKIVRRSIYDEIFPTVALPDAEKKFFADSIVERFLNPFAHHQLLSISLNSVSKYKVRVLPTLLDYLKMKGELPKFLTFALAALLRFYRIEVDREGKATGCVDGKNYPVSDSPEVLAFFARNRGLAAGEFTRSALANQDFWEMDLTSVPLLAETVSRHLENIEKHGVRQALKDLLQ
ncbi:MAG: tagaturonate reductase [Victivallaceae bacterium]|nr:tagaturonate reductase [Victivallaceae bacterium]